MNLRRRTFSAVRWTAVDTAGQLIFRIASITVLARILAPEDYGLMAIVTVIVGFAGLFSDMGVNSAFVQRRDVSDEQRSSLFWLNVLAGLVVATALAVFSPLIAAFYGEPRLKMLVVLAASIFIVRALGQQVKMSAQKDLLFRAVVAADLVAAAIGFAVAVLAALADWGVYALVASAIVTAASATALYWILVSGGWRPIYRLRLNDIRSFLGFGGAAVGNSVVNYLNRTADIFLGARILEASALGFYSLPRTLTLQLGTMINATVTRVGFPLIAQVQENSDKVRSVYLKTVNMTTSINAPLYIGIAFFAKDIVQVVLGPGWEQSVQILQVLALWGGFRATGNPVGSLLYGMGRADLSLYWNLGLLCLIPFAVWIGSASGALGIAYALLIVQIILLVPCWFILVRPLCGAGFTEYFRVVLAPFAISTFAILPAYLAAEHTESAIVSLLAGAGLAIPTYLLLSYWVNREWLEIATQVAKRQ